MPYEMRGMFLEACDCRVICPCWLDEEPDEQACTGLMAWYIEQGQVDGVDVSGLTVTSVSHHDGHRHSGGQEVVLVIDEGASDDQAAALEGTFRGDNGGPLAELRELAGAEPTVRRAPVTYGYDGTVATVQIGAGGELGTVDMVPRVGALKRVTTLADSALAVLLGTPAEVGTSTKMRISINRAPLDTEVERRSATRGRFHYRLPA